MPKAVRNSTPPGIPRERWVKQVSARLGLLRKWLGLSEQEMADRLGITVHAYRDYELGRSKWNDVAFALRLADATNVSVDWMWCGGYWDGPASRIPLAIDGRPMRPVLRVVSS